LERKCGNGHTTFPHKSNMGIIEKSSKIIKRFSTHPAFFPILFLLLLLSVALTSFAIGGMYERHAYLDAHPIEQRHTEKIIKLWEEENRNAWFRKEFFASKNGSVYYPLSCEAGKRIAKESRVYFQDEREAQSLGYHKGKRCD